MNKIAAHSSLEVETYFRKSFSEYSKTFLLDELRSTTYARLDRLKHVYLDYTGGGLYADSQVHAHMDLLLNHVFGNTHSTNPTSIATSTLIDQAQAYVLSFFNASPDEYFIIFTQNATGALKLVGESYPFGGDSQYLLISDNHNSVNGIREFARVRGATVTYSPVIPPDLRIDCAALRTRLERANPQAHNLFAYPAQSNFSGVQHSLEWIAQAQSQGWDVLLDAAAYAPTNRLDLSAVRPDFVAISFYKIFGYPTGLGCLIARKRALSQLHRPWFSGGTITVASVQGNRHFLHDGAEAFEDGTLNYLGIPAIEIGLRHIDAIGYDVIHTRVACLTEWLLNELHALHHDNGLPVVHIYGPATAEARGGTIALNFYGTDGHFIDHLVVEDRANRAGISLRTGCFCNPGAGELALGISTDELSACFAQVAAQFTFDDFRRCFDERSTGAVRISLGLVSNFRDVHRFLEFAHGFLNKCATMA